MTSRFQIYAARKYIIQLWKTLYIKGLSTSLFVFFLWSATMGAYHLARKSGNFGLKSNGKVIFRKFCSEIVEYLQRYSSFSVRYGTAEISLPFAKLSSFQSLISRKQLLEIEVQMVSAISFGWFAHFGKPLTLFNARPNRFILTNGKHPISPS